MNRLLQYADPLLEFASKENSAESPLLDTTDSRERNSYKLFVPMHYERNYAYPLLVWLHNGEASERQLTKIMPHISLRNYVAIAPRGTASRYEADGSETIACWDQTSEGIESAREAVRESIQTAVSRCHVNPRKIFVAGYADGGTMALRIALTLPGQFAGAISFHGPLPKGHRPLRHINLARGGAVMMFTGKKSLAYPETEVCRDVKLLHSAGFSVVARHYDTDDDVSSEMLAEMNRWMMDIVTQAAQEARRYPLNEISQN
jgi:phospholipase/carboxylesterase